jgi:DNA-binding protein Fis
VTGVARTSSACSKLCEGQKTKAAAMLGIHRTTLWKELRQYGLDGD